MSRTLLALALIFLAPAAASQPVSLHAPCVLHGEAVAPDVDPATLSRLATHTVVTRRSATFEVTYTGFTAEAEAAFQRAVDIWADHLTSTVPIRVTASFAPLGSGVLGSAGPLSAYSGRPQFPLPDTLYPDALADALVGSSQGGTSADIQARFNSSFGGFYFGLDGDPPSNRYDFVTVVLHELGHGLGFIGSARYDDGTDPAECTGTEGIGCWGFGGRPIVFDRFVEDGAGNEFLDTSLYPNPSQALGDLLIADDLFFDGATLTATQGGFAPPVYGPTPFRTGSSYSHFDEGTFVGTADALMTPFIAPGEAYSSPGVTTCALFSDLGWPLGDGCQFLVADERGAAAASALRLGSANPARGAAVLSLSLDAPGPVRADLLDALGRRVTTLFSGQAAGEVRLRTPSDLAPGAYVVRVTTDAGTSSAPIVRL